MTSKKHKKHETDISVWPLKIGQVGGGTETLTAYRKAGARFRKKELQGVG